MQLSIVHITFQLAVCLDRNGGEVRLAKRGEGELRSVYLYNFTTLEGYDLLKGKRKLDPIIFLCVILLPLPLPLRICPSISRFRIIDLLLLSFLFKSGHPNMMISYPYSLPEGSLITNGIVVLRHVLDYF